MVMCAVVRLRALMARQAARLITNPPIAFQLEIWREIKVRLMKHLSKKTRKQ
jgi:hypothetical protein